ncbi:hypothetical protein V2J09_001183, partial [Rumex salicifolius]
CYTFSPLCSNLLNSSTIYVPCLSLNRTHTASLSCFQESADNISGTKNDVFGPWLHKFVLVFFDDILVYSVSLEDHVSHLGEVLQLMHQHRLIAKAVQISLHKGYLCLHVPTNLSLKSPANPDLTNPNLIAYSDSLTTIITNPRPYAITTGVPVTFSSGPFLFSCLALHAGLSVFLWVFAYSFITGSIRNTSSSFVSSYYFYFPVLLSCS